MKRERGRTQTGGDKLSSSWADRSRVWRRQEAEPVGCVHTEDASGQMVRRVERAHAHTHTHKWCQKIWKTVRPIKKATKNTKNTLASGVCIDKLHTAFSSENKLPLVHGDYVIGGCGSKAPPPLTCKSSLVCFFSSCGQAQTQCIAASY